MATNQNEELAQKCYGLVEECCKNISKKTTIKSPAVRLPFKPIFIFPIIVYGNFKLP